MSFSIALFKYLFPPGLILVAGFLVAETLQSFPDSFLFFLAYLPYFFLGVSSLLCLQFNQSRLLFTLLNISFLYMVLHALDFSLLRLYEFVLIFWILLNMAALSWLPERSVMSVHSLVKLGVMLLQLLLSWYLLSYQFLVAENIFYGAFLGEPPAWLNFSSFLAVVALLSVLTVSARFLYQSGPVEAAMLISTLMLVSFLGKACEQSLAISATMAAGIFCFVAVILDSHQMAYRDELTGLRSRRALNQYLTGLGRKYTIAMMDIDHFKKFNDNHGHDIGDQMLKLVASKIAKVSGGGTPFRYGGEEFTVVFPRRTVDDVIDHLEALRESIEGYPLILRSKERPNEAPKDKKKLRKKNNSQPQTLSCTISIGLASRGDQLKTPEQVIKGADEALYRAKKKGRNCVSV